MDRKPAILGIVLVTLLWSAFLCQAQDVRVVQPTDGDAVRGVVTVLGDKAHPEEGYMTLKVRSATGTEEFVGACITPFKLLWNSSDRAGEARRFPDGDYSLLVSGHNPTGEAMGRAVVAVTVANDVADEAAAQGVMLRYKFARNDRTNYRLVGRSKLRPAEEKDLESKDPAKKYAAEQRMMLANQQKMQMTYLELQSDVDWSESVIGAAEGGGGTVRKSVSSGWLDFGSGQPQMIGQVGKTFRLLVRPNGKQEPKRPGDPALMWGSQTIEVPATVLKPGDNWESRVGFVPHDMVYSDPNDPEKSGAKFAKAFHTLEGFEWHSGYKCARIRSTFDYNGRIVLRNGYAFETDMTGERTTYFAYEQGKQVAFSERLEHEFEVQTGGAMGGAIQGTPGLPGAMGLPGMQGPPGFGGGMPPGLGGAVPGMEMPGMMPGGMPGMPMAGAPMPPGMGGVPGMEIPGMGGAPMPPGMGGVPGMEMPGMPGMPGMGGMPGMPGMGGMGGMGGMQPAEPLKFKLIVYHDVGPAQ